MDFNNPVVLVDEMDADLSDEGMHLNQSSGRTRKIPLLDCCSFCKNPLLAAIGRITGFKMLLYISFIYLMPVFFLWSKYICVLDFVFLVPGQAPTLRRVSFLRGYPALRFSFGLLLALLLLFSEAVEVYCYVANFINVRLLGSSIDDFLYDGNNGTFGGRDVEASGSAFCRHDSTKSKSSQGFAEWFRSLSAKFRYIHVFHHLRWFMMSSLVSIPPLVMFSINLYYYKGAFMVSRYYIETMDFALGLLLPMACIMIFTCIVYPIYLITVTIVSGTDVHYSSSKVSHSLAVLCLQDSCPCEQLVKEQVSPAVKRNLERHSIYLGFGKLIFVISTGILFICSLVSIFLL
ncbi:hypothetical protein BMR1_03g02095 [Babesia microti strain RI]|uniref:Uncharacterized protein n=1 Tax=Babesia microti (strain RI) TaxID=1133968 RepID=A0A0K3AQW6_BABMR|nr:hypothetical protein BMR1_03g02095 [Babesia microti strain RI]CTQ41018.1 hypothetical protein BMR1_03g02095 [Babesia microti strain RI]|eukprot:XP_012649029.1 hypothetical protein BMR1_03g02095 [Babesia microti strain RI]